MGAFMRQRSVIAFGIAERFERRHLHEVGFDIVIGHIAAVTDVGFCIGKERLGALNALHRIEPWFGNRMEMRRQAFDLLDIEHGIGFEERDGFLCILSRLLIRAAAGHGAGIHNRAAALALADMGVQFQRLPEGHPDRSAVAFGDRLAPQHQHIDPLIGQTVRPQGPCDAPRRVLGVPWLHPWPDPLLQTRHNLIGDVFVKIGFHWPSPFKTGCACNPSRPAPMSGGAAVKAGGGVEGDRPVCTTLLRRKPTAKAAMNKTWRKTGDTPRAALKRAWP